MSSQVTYLKINKFRHVRPGSVINFKPQFNAFVGQNGAGKTTLLNLISALVRNNFAQFVRDSFSIDFVLTDGAASLRGTLENTVADSRGKFTFVGELNDGESFHIESNEIESLITVGDRKFTAGSVVPAKSEGDLSFAPIIAARRAISDADNDVKFGPLSGAPRDVVFQQFESATRLGEGAETFYELFLSQDGELPRLGVTFIAAGDEITVWGHNVSVNHIPSEWSKNAEGSDALALGCEFFPLEQFVRLSQYKDARLIFVKTATSTNEKRTVWIFGNPLARFRTPGGDEVSHDHLSFGEKRLLAFLLKLYSHTPTIVVDELANGMHHSWLEHCLGLIEDLHTQAFLSSQNPLLLDCLPLNRETYATAHTLVICELTDSGEMVWRNLTETETEDFFRSLDVGLQHISEIMRAKGLW